MEVQDLTLPCRECITYAICKNRSTVRCEILYKIAKVIPMDDEKIAVWWGIIKLSLPYAVRIIGRKKS
jgi:hypothetical protein